MEILSDHTGRRIRLTAERRRHVLEHPEMAGMEAAIGATLARPSAVIQSVSDPLVNLYYRHYQRTPVGGKWLCVVVKAGAADAFVITAYLTDKPKRGTQLWPASS